MLQRFLYLSRLAPKLNFDAATQILRQSRERNQADGISGALVFDGERFCQLIEGPPALVRELAARIAIDPRHGAMHVLVDEIEDAPRCLAKWRGGFCEPAALDPFDIDGTIDPPLALTAFLAILDGCDLSP